MALFRHHRVKELKEGALMPVKSGKQPTALNSSAEAAEEAVESEEAAAPGVRRSSRLQAPRLKAQ